MPRRRARAPEDKAARRAEILATAARLFDARDGQLGQLTMAALAREAGLAKGTLYLYFQTKEEIFLALVLEELGAWIGALDRALDATGPTSTAEQVAAAVTATLVPRERLLALLGLLHPVLEQNLPAEVIRSFKEQLALLLAEPAARLERRLPALAPGGGVRLVLRLHALVVGLQLTTRPPPRVAEVVDACPHLAAMRLDFEQELRGTLAALLRGWR